MSIRYSERLSNKTSELPAKECIIVQFNRCATCNILLERGCRLIANFDIPSSN